VTGPGVAPTVTTADPVEPAKPFVPWKLAVIVFEPIVSFPAVKTKDAIAVEPFGVSINDTRFAAPNIKLTCPAGALEPVAAFTEIVNVVVCDAVMLTALTAKAVVVGTEPPVRVTLAGDEVPMNDPFPAYVAMIVFTPAANAPAANGNVAVAVEPEAFSAAVPIVFPPIEKLMLPEGAAIPETGNSVTARVVLPEGEILDGLGVTVIVVPTLDVNVIHCSIMFAASTEPRPVTRS